jgi:hypothetical protein
LESPRKESVDITPTASDRAAAAEKTSAKKSFTSEKLDWINSLMMDHRLKPIERLGGIAYAQTVNEQTRISKASDQLIADRLGVSRRTVIRLKQKLCDYEWLACRRPENRRLPNETKLLSIPKNIESIKDQQTALKDQRDYERGR